MLVMYCCMAALRRVKLCDTKAAIDLTLKRLPRLLLMCMTLQHPGCSARCVTALGNLLLQCMTLYCTALLQITNISSPLAPDRCAEHDCAVAAYHAAVSLLMNEMLLSGPCNAQQ